MDQSASTSDPYRHPAASASIDAVSNDRFRLGTYPGVRPPAAAILDVETNRVYPFGEAEAARVALHKMQTDPDGHHYAPISYVVGYLFTEDEAAS